VVFTEHGPAVLIPCPICNGSDRQIEYLVKLSGLTGAELHCSFGEYWTTLHGDAPLGAANDVLKGRGWLTLSGGYGRGKTYLLMAITNEAVKRGMKSVYVGMERLLDHLRVAFKPGVEVEYDAMWDTITSADVLCLDEIEKYNPTPWAETRVKELLDDRYRAFASQTTVLATNDLAGCPGWLKSRILDGRFRVVSIGGSDVRPGLKRGGIS
jgi:DNA replication protein DnaC